MTFLLKKDSVRQAPSRGQLQFEISRCSIVADQHTVLFDVLDTTYNTFLHLLYTHTHTMPVKQLDTPYPVIDADPHFSRVVRSFRSSDYAAMAGATAAFPSAIYLMEMFDPTRPKRGLGSALRLSTFLGLCGGFLFAYQRSSFRFWGWKENELEQQANQAAIDAGIKPPGTDPSKSDLTPYMQGVAHRNSAFSQLKFSKLQERAAAGRSAGLELCQAKPEDSLLHPHRNRSADHIFHL